MRPNILILCGDGINCEHETAEAFRIVGGNPHLVHIRDLFENPQKLLDYQILALPGGFSFGDDLGGAQILALKFQLHLRDVLERFIQEKRPILGICNGFQVLIRLNLLTPSYLERPMSLTVNKPAFFINRWVTLEVNEEASSIWTQGLKTHELPIRHKEGRVVFTHNKIYTDLLKKGQIVMCYHENINGSYQRIAAISDESGLIFGLMPHPEAFIYSHQFYNKVEKSIEPSGRKIFANGVHYVQ